MSQLTLEQAIIITGYTGITACSFGDFHGDVERRLGRPVFTHEFADEKFSDNVKELYREDFLKIAVK